MYKYLIETDDLLKAEFVRQVLVNHGFCYEWEIKERVATTSFVNISIVSDKGRIQKKVDLTITNSSEFLQNLGLEPLVLSNFPKLTYILNSRMKAAKKVSPILWQCINPFRILDKRWLPDAFIYNSGNQSCISVICKHESTHSIVIGIDLPGYISHSMLGPSKNFTDKFSDWSQIYGYSQTQGLASMCHVESVINFILNYLVIYGGNAIPGRIHYYPPGLSAPVLVTGDTDSATEEDIQNYSDFMFANEIHSTLLVKDFSPFSHRLIKSLLANGHSFGIHPYSENSTFDEFNGNFLHLIKQLHDLSKKKPFGVRNHRFQLINRDLQIDLENNYQIDFDLNCVAASGRTWIGSGSGLGHPLPFWDNERKTLTTILQLPTIIEDDVFLYNFDYCYKPFITGAYLPTDMCIEFLNYWLIEKELPCCINLHPEHIKHKYALLSKNIVGWLREKGIWAPNLYEFSNWIKKRNSTMILAKNQEAIIDTEILVEFMDNKGSHFCYPGIQSIEMFSNG